MSQGGTYRSQNENFDIGSPKNEEISEVWVIGLSVRFVETKKIPHHVKKN